MRKKRARWWNREKEKIGLEIFYWAFVCELSGSVMCIRFANAMRYDRTVMNDNIQLHIGKREFANFNCKLPIHLFFFPSSSSSLSSWQRRPNFSVTAFIVCSGSFSRHVHFNFQMNCMKWMSVLCFYARNARCIFNRVSVWFTQCACLLSLLKVLLWYEWKIRWWKNVILNWISGPWADVIECRPPKCPDDFWRYSCRSAIHQTDDNVWCRFLKGHRRNRPIGRQIQLIVAFQIPPMNIIWIWRMR